MNAYTFAATGQILTTSVYSISGLSGTDKWDWASKIPDVNGDGREDILARRSDDNSLRLYVSDMETHNYKYSKQVGQNWGGIKLLTVLNTDVSGDGTPDIVALGSNNELLRYSWKDIKNPDGSDAGSGFGDQTQIGQNWKQICELT